jgi:hypothetical protein
VTAVTRKVERFTSRSNSFTLDKVVHGREPVLTVAPVPVTTGRVLDAAGKPVPGTVLWVEDPQHEKVFVLSTTAGRDGRFTLPGQPTGLKRLRVVAFPPDGAPFHRVSRTVPDDAAERKAFDLVLPRGIPATVKVIDKAPASRRRTRISYGRRPADNPSARRCRTAWHGGSGPSGLHEPPAAPGRVPHCGVPGKGCWRPSRRGTGW